MRDWAQKSTITEFRSLANFFRTDSGSGYRTNIKMENLCIKVHLIRQLRDAENYSCLLTVDRNY